MSEELVKIIQDMLKEETWTRATISNYTKNNLIELAGIIEKAKTENCIHEIKEICDEHLSHTKDSIIALYISGMLGLIEGDLDNSSLVNLIDIFQKNHKETIVNYLCESILSDDPNNKFALRTLATSYHNDNKEEVWDLYEKIVKLDLEEADIAKQLADHYEKLNDMDKAIEYYKKALLRYTTRKNLTCTKEMWTKLISLIPEEIDFFLLVQRKIAKNISESKSALFMQELYVYYKDNEKWNTAIDILKLIISIDVNDSWARKEVVECYRGKYADHTHLEDYIRSSNLTQSFRNVFEAINDFEKHIAFDVNSFVFHRAWGVGIIQKVENDTLFINFGKNKGIHQMSLKMAVNALIPLARNHIWVLKATQPQAALSKMVKSDKEWTLKTIIKSFDNSCDFKRIKAELVPSILSTSEWTSWNTAAKKILSTNAIFGVNPNDISQYTVRDHEISIEEKLSAEFKAQKQFFARVNIIMSFLNNEETDSNSELFADMFNYFTGFLKSIAKVNEQVLASYLVVQTISAAVPALSYPVKFTFAELYQDIENPKEMYTLLKDTKNTTLRQDFLTNIRMLPNWSDEYIKLFPTVLEKTMLIKLIDKGYTEKVQQLAAEAFENPRDYRDAVLYFFKECQDEDWFKESGVPYEKQLIALLNIISVTFYEIDNHVNTTENKKINKNTTNLLFKDDTLINYMLENDQDSLKRLYTLVNDIQNLDPALKTAVRNKIVEKFPNFEFHIVEERSNAPQGMLVTAKKLEEKKAQAEQLQKVEMPKNAEEISEARAQGDLKENAEYKAAREHQHYLQVTLTKLQGELNRAIIFDPTTVTTGMVSFGTKVTLHNEITGNDEEYTILGPWESNPEHGIISYMSPFGNAILELKQGEKTEFTINENKYSFTVTKIAVAQVQ